MSLVRKNHRQSSAELQPLQMTFAQDAALNSAQVASSWQLCFLPQALAFFLEHPGCLPLLLGFSRKRWVFAVLVRAEEPEMCNQEPQERSVPTPDSCRGALRAGDRQPMPTAALARQRQQVWARDCCGSWWQLVAASLEGPAAPLPCPDTRIPHTCPTLPSLLLQAPHRRFHAAQDGSSVCKQRWHSWKSPKSSRIKPIFKFTWLVHNPCAKKGSRQDVALRAAGAQQQILQEKLNHAGARISKDTHYYSGF